MHVALLPLLLLTAGVLAFLSGEREEHYFVPFPLPLAVFGLAVAVLPVLVGVAVS